MAEDLAAKQIVKRHVEIMKVIMIMTIGKRHPVFVTILPIFRWRPLFVNGIPIDLEMLAFLLEIPVALFNENPPSPILRLLKLDRSHCLLIDKTLLLTARSIGGLFSRVKG